MEFRSLPIAATVAQEPDPRAGQSLPPTGDHDQPALSQHWRRMMARNEGAIHDFRISADGLRIAFDATTGNTYVALMLEDVSMYPLPMAHDPHMSITHDVVLPGWVEFWRLKHELSTLLSPRKVTAVLQARRNSWEIMAISELAVLQLMLFEVCRKHYAGCTMVDAHITFTVLGNSSLA